MDQWYYARGGQQNGPISFEQLSELVRNGAVGGADLVWTESMKDWTPAAQVQGLVGAPAQGTSPATAPVSDPSNPYAAPQSAWVEPVVSAGDALAEIVPGSDPLDPSACIKRGFEIAKRNAGTVALTIVVYLAITYGLSIIQQVLQVALGAGTGTATSSEYSGTRGLPGALLGVMIGFGIFNQIVTIFLNLGMIRIWLNLVSGKQATVGMIFGEGGKLFTAVVASILFGFAVVIGFLLLIVPGVYIALRYGQFMAAIVDKNLGIMDSLSYSSSITTNNRMPLFLFWLLAMLVMIAGLLALCVGVFVAMPIVALGGMVAYRWMQYGHRAAMDHPGTLTPMLSNQ